MWRIESLTNVVASTQRKTLAKKHYQASDYTNTTTKLVDPFYLERYLNRFWMQAYGVSEMHANGTGLQADERNNCVPKPKKLPIVSWSSRMWW
jgi:hypothetical protein